MTTEERLTKLERKNRRLTLGIVLAGLATSLAAAVGMAAPGIVPDEVKARKFILVDDDGKGRASLYMSEDGAGLSLLDANGMTRVLLVASENGPGLFMFSESGKPSVNLTTRKNAPVSLGLLGENSTSSATLEASERGAAVAIWYNRGKEHAEFGVNNETGIPTLRLFDAKGRLRAALGIDFKETIPKLWLFDANGKGIWGAP